MLELLTKYWPIAAGLVVVVGPTIWSLITSALGKFKMPSLTLKGGVSNVDNDLLKSKDQEAIDWLANRAVDVSDDKLIMEMESVNTKFYHMHRIMRKPVTSAK